MAPSLQRAALALLGALVVTTARGDVFSPGELSRPHASLEGLSNCTKCHAAGEQLSPDNCLACHKDVAARIRSGKGLHGRIKVEERSCQLCHHEHTGRETKLVDWGTGGKKGFDHARTGFALEGKHRKPDCAKCHDARHISDPEVLQAIAKGRDSLLGTPSACAACHFDEHRAQLGADCQRCHSAETWKLPRFDHAKAAYKLEGKHQKVACLKCHADQPAPPAGELGPRTPPARPTLFARYKPIPFQICTDCHKDPHLGRFGVSCAGCHGTDDWKKLRGAAKEKAFHEKTKYPLRGAHLQAACTACHGPWGKEKAVFKGMKFERCSDCHLDAHLGQLSLAAPVPAPAPAAAAGAPPVPPRSCDRCHTVEGFAPVRFELEDHEKLAYKLEGAHRAVACAACHPKDPRLEAKVPAAVKARLVSQGRPVKPSLALLKIPRATDCRTCHRDPHGGQFKARTDAEGCTACHGLESWKKARFDHAKDSRFPLAGKHAKAACASCHRPGPSGAVVYKPLAVTCAGCHPDIHAGQLALPGKGTDCARCHDAAGWKEKENLRFDHQRDSRFKLEGKHKPLACEKCHLPVTVGKGVTVRRYKPLPLTCEGCHADFHRGSFKGYQP
jgi:hypothetical protein